MRVEVPWLVYHSHPEEGHAFLRGSVSPEDLPPEVRAVLVDFTDRSPRYGDGRQTWSPYPSGRPIGEHYVVTWTRPHPTAHRPGSILTQALLFPREVLAASANLAGALRAAATPLDEVTPLQVELEDGPPQVRDAGRAVVAALVRGAGRPVALLGEETWHPAVTETWGALWPEARGQLHFRAFETPHDVVGDPDLLLVPAPGGSWTAPAWNGGVVRGPFPATPEPPVLAALRGPDGPLAGQASGSVRELRRLNALGAALRDAGQGVGEATHALTVLVHAPLRLEARKSLARDLAQRIGGALPDQDGSVVEALGEVPADLVGPLAPAVAAWFSRALHVRPGEARRAAEATGGARTQPWLTDALCAGLRAVAPGEDVARVLWTWWDSGALRTLTLPALGGEWDRVLATTRPTTTAGSPLRGVALAQGWPRLYGVLTAREGDLDALLTIPGERRPAALEGARAELAPGAFLGWAVRHSGHDVLEAAAHSLVADPAVLLDADLGKGAWLEVWAEALPRLPEPDSARRRGDVLDLVLCGHDVPDNLLRALARGGGGNLLAHPERNALLARLPVEYREQTAGAYLGSPVDPGEATGVLLSAVRARLRHVTPSPAAARRLFTTPGLSETELRQVERQAAQALTAEDAPLIERLPLAAARRLLGWVPPQVRWPLRHLLAPLEAVQVAAELGQVIEPLTWWNALEEFGVTVADAKTLWDQLKASTADFPAWGSARDHWRHAARELQQGRGPKVRDVLQRLEERRPSSPAPWALKTTCPVNRQP